MRWAASCLPMSRLRINKPAIRRVWNLYSYVRNNPLRFTDPTGNACVQGADGNYSDDNSGGQTCAQVDADNAQQKPSATVTGAPGSLPMAILTNAFFALDNVANDWFRPLTNAMEIQPSYMQNLPVSSGALGRTVNVTVIAGTYLLGPGEVKGAQGLIQISEHAAAAMTEHGVSTAMVEKAIQVGEKFYDPKNDSVVYVVRKGMASGKDLAVAVNKAGTVLKTVMVNANAVRPRFQPM